MAEKTQANSDSNKNNSNIIINECSASGSDKTENDTSIPQGQVKLEGNDIEMVSSSDEIKSNKCIEESKNDDADVVSSTSPSSTMKTSRSKIDHDESIETESNPRQGCPGLGKYNDDGGDGKVSKSKALTRGSHKSKYPDKSSNAYAHDDDHEDEYKQEEKDRFLNMEIDEKRKIYKCRTDFKTLDQIKTWPVYYAENQYRLERKVKVKKDKHFPVNEALNSKISVVRDDITCLEIDAIVNAANESLLGGGGVDGAIHTAAGKLLVRECATLDGCNVGEAKITGGYKLPAKFVIHTVGPRGERPQRLAECYLNSLNHMKENNLRSIAFPCISTGIFGYPNLKAANVALETIRRWLEEGDNAENVDRIILCLFLQRDVDIYDGRMQVYFPVHGSPAAEAAPKEEPSDPSNTETSL